MQCEPKTYFIVYYIAYHKEEFNKLLYCDYTGKPRETEEEIKAGQVDVSSSESPYTTKHLTYSKEDFQALVDLTTYNIVNNKEILLETIRKVMEKRAAKQ